MDTIRLTINTIPRTKKNSSRIVQVKGRPILLPSKQYLQFEQQVVRQTSPFFFKTIAHPINIQCTFYMPTRRKVDLTNLLEAIDDALVKAKVIEDDNCGVVVSHDLSRVKYDKDNPRIEITITESNEVDENFRKEAK